MEKACKNILLKEGSCRKAHETSSPSFVFDIRANSAPSVLFLHSPSAVVLLQATFVYADFSRTQFSVCVCVCVCLRVWERERERGEGEREDSLRHKRTQRRFLLQIKTTKFKIRTLILLLTCCSTVPIPGLKRKIRSRCKLNGYTVHQ